MNDRDRNEARRRDTFGEVMDGIAELTAHSEGRLTLRTHKVEAPPAANSPTIDEIRRRAQAAIDGVVGLSWGETRKRIEGRVAKRMRSRFGRRR